MMGPLIETLIVGPLAVNCYLVACPETREAVLIDPAAPEPEIANRLARHQLRVRWLINTHGHADHTAGNDYWAAQTGAAVVIHAADWKFFSTPAMQALAQAEGFPPLTRADRLVQDGDRLPCGRLTLTILHTPGHTPGSICLYLPGHLFTGDTLFVESAGRTDLPGGSLERLIASLQEKILPLPDDTIIWPGHDYGTTPTSTLGREKENNPYITDFLE